MNPAIEVKPDDIKKILAEKFGVDPKNVVKAQYSYFVIKEEKN